MRRRRMSLCGMRDPYSTFGGKDRQECHRPRPTIQGPVKGVSTVDTLPQFCCLPFRRLRAWSDCKELFLCARQPRRAGCSANPEPSHRWFWDRRTNRSSAVSSSNCPQVHPAIHSGRHWVSPDDSCSSVLAMHFVIEEEQQPEW